MDFNNLKLKSVSNMISDLDVSISSQVSFTGIWSRNIHPANYPENDWIPRFSDMVGASHAADFILWSPGTLATDGLKDLAEHANSSKFEAEIREKVCIFFDEKRKIYVGAYPRK